MHRGQLGPTSSGFALKHETKIRAPRPQLTYNALLVNDGRVNVKADGIGLGQAFHVADNVGTLERGGPVAEMGENLLTGGCRCRGERRRRRINSAGSAGGSHARRCHLSGGGNRRSHRRKGSNAVGGTSGRTGDG